MAAKKVAAARLSVVWSFLLVMLKVLIGLVTGSVSVLAEAIHSATDMVAAGLALFSVRMAGRPADPDHPYGHGKWENLSGTVEAGIIMIASAGIIWEALRRIEEGGGVERLSWAMGVMLFASVVNYFISGHLFRVARETDSIALVADGSNLRTDVYSSAGVLAGLALISLTGWTVLDAWIAIAVGLVNIRVALRISRGAVGPLLDVALPEDETGLIDRLLREDPRVLGYHKLRTRRAGPFRHVDVHLFVDDNMGVTEAHEVAEKAEDRIRQALSGVQIVTHVEPWSEQTPQERSRSLRWREQQ